MYMEIFDLPDGEQDIKYYCYECRDTKVWNLYIPYNSDKNCGRCDRKTNRKVEMYTW